MLNPNALSAGQCRPVVSVSNAMYSASANLTMHPYHFATFNDLDDALILAIRETALKVAPCNLGSAGAVIGSGAVRDSPLA